MPGGCKNMGVDERQTARGSECLSFSQGACNVGRRYALLALQIGRTRASFFDEATSALDFETERIIQQNM